MIHEVKTILNIWSSRGLTLLGKITILKGLITVELRLSELIKTRGGSDKLIVRIIALLEKNRLHHFLADL